MATTISAMQPKPARPTKVGKTRQAANLPALSSRDSAALALALDECAPSNATQEDMLHRVLFAINKDSGRTPALDGSSKQTNPQVE
jgi:hypothetical protein